MKKCAIITIVEDNYGNRLQNYAVQHVLNSMGINSETINIDNTLGIKHSMKLKVKALIYAITPKFAYERWKTEIRKIRIMRFSGKYIRRKTINNGDFQTLSKLVSKYSKFIVGSDQVWNPTFGVIANSIDLFLLEFAQPQQKISYASSFGIRELPIEWKEKFSNALATFKAISIREDSGAEIVKKLSGREVDVLIDPTLMIHPKEWRKIEEVPRVSIGNKYILVYFLGNLNAERREKIQAVADRNNLIIYDLLDQSRGELYTVNPGEFLYLLEHSTLVCTDSFHAVVFSILFERPFWVFDREQNSIGNMGDRITTLLKKLHLEERLPNIISDEKLLNYNYKNINDFLQKEREKAIIYLKRAMEVKY